jgi:hypothetical protein
MKCIFLNAVDRKRILCLDVCVWGGGIRVVWMACKYKLDCRIKIISL